MKLLFKTPGLENQKGLELDVNPDELVESVRKKVSKKGVDCAKLIVRGISLKDDKSIKSYNVKEGETLIIQTTTFSQYLPKGVRPDDKKKDAPAQGTKRPAADLEIIGGTAEPAAPDPKRVAYETPNDADVPKLKLKVGVFGDKGARRTMEDGPRMRKRLYS